MATKYKLTLNLPVDLKDAQQRVLEGHNDVVVTRADGYVGELTDEQLALAKADPYISVAKAGAAGNDDGGAGTQQTEESPLAKLLKKKRGKLDKMAKDAGIEKPEEMKDKQAVAEAILAASKTEEVETPEGGGDQGGEGGEDDDESEDQE